MASETIQVLLQPHRDGINPDSAQTRYRVLSTLTFAQFICLIRDKIPKLDPASALFFFIGATGNLPPLHASMSSLYNQYREPLHANPKGPGFLRIVYAFENTFGAS